MEYKLYPAEFKMVEDGNGSISGYASTFANWDSVKERPVKGAFAPHLPAFLKRGFIAVAHEWGPLGIGMPKEAYEDDHGLFVRALFHSTPDAQLVRTKIRERMHEGNEVSLSIGYEVVQDDFVPEGRLLKEIKLYEWSIVNVPANDQATLTSIKSQRLSLPDHSETVLAAVDDLTARMVGLRDLRMKEGRVLSDANRKRIQTLLDALTSVQAELTDLLAATEPKASSDTAKALYIEFQRIEARINGAFQ